MPLNPNTRLGPYEIVAPLGAGGMGEVYRARDTRLDRDVAIKALPEHLVNDVDRLARFEREAKIVASLNHPNIAAVYTLEQEGTRKYLVMEYVQGETLAARLRRGFLPFDEAIQIAAQMAEALEAAHEKDIIHRDLKPGNVMLTPEGMVKVLDFGLARSGAGESSPTAGFGPSSPTITSPAVVHSPTIPGVILGTAGYMSPEQARGKPVDKRSDIFSFGCVHFEMLTGRQPFAGETVTDSLGAIVHKEPDWSALPLAVPPRIRELLADCLAKNRKHRLHHFADVRIALQNVNASFDETFPRTSPGLPRNKVILVAVAAVCSFIAREVWIWTKPQAPPSAPVVRTSIELDAGFLAGEGIAPVALSPDGRLLALVGGRTSDEEKHIWIRSLDSLAAQPLQGTEDASHPFWSPDGKNIGFFAKGKLRRIPAVGGTVTLICDAEKARGGAWSIDGTIVFAPKPFGPLMRVSAAGGMPTPITEVTNEKETHRLPSFLPDGRRLLFTRRDYSIEGNVEIMMLDLASGKTTALKEWTSGFYAPPGFLIFGRGANLMAQPFDATGVTLAGEAVVLAENVSMNYGRMTGAISVSAQGTLVYRTSDFQSQLQWFDMDGRPREKIGEPAEFTFLDLDSDGKLAAAIIRRDDGSHDGWIFDTTRGTRSKVVDNVAGCGMFWSPDGKSLTYHGPGMRCHIRGIDGASMDVNLTDGWPNSWSRDGKLLCISRQDTKTGVDNLLIDATGGEARPFRVAPGFEARRVFSPDGNWLAYLSDGSGRAEIVIAAVSGTGPAYQLAPSANSPSTFLRWLDDGKLIFEDISGEKLLAVTTQVHDGRMEFGAALSTFGGLDVPSDVFTISRDGKRMLAAVRDAKENAESLVLVQNWPAAISEPR